MHDRGCMAGNREDYTSMNRWLRKAIAEREEIRDDLGLAWSFNNLAYYLLNKGDLRSAMPSLKSAYELVLAGESVPASSVAVNLQRVLEWNLTDKPDRKRVQWWWSLADLAASSKRPESISAERLVRMAHSTELKRGGPRKAIRAAERLIDYQLPGRPPEVRTDLMLLACDAAILGSEFETARDWAAGLQVGNGPCAEHLEARKLVLQARIYAGLGEALAYDEHVRLAMSALNSLGATRFERESLATLASAGEALSGSEMNSVVSKAASDAKRRGRPGGAGGRVQTLSPSPQIRGLKETAPVFSLSWSAEDKIVLRDLLAEQEIPIDLSWKPHNHTLNGLSLGVFGGYVQVRSMNYGGSTPSGGSPGETRLDEWGDYRPIASEGSLLITKNGAVSYQLD